VVLGGGEERGLVEALRRGEEKVLLEALRRGDEAAFLALVNRHHGAMVRLARAFVRSDAVAEEVAQEAWLAALEGLAAFRGEAGVKGWLLAIVANRARSRAVKEARSVPLSSLGPGDDGEGDGGPAVDPDRFLPADHPEWPGHWSAAPAPFPEARLLAAEAADKAKAAIAALPARQQAVITLRDVEGLSAEEACLALGLSEENQRVLLHRARSKVRAELEAWFAEGEAP
jgi:RNA polymerase sigma-70 factor (ECF subfamily)